MTNHSTLHESAAPVVDRYRTGAVISDRWSDHAKKMFLVAIAILVAYALWKQELTTKYRSLVADSVGAADLRPRHHEVQRWFSGKAVYGEIEHGGIGATYPPQSFVVLWPFLGWMTIGAARWLWATTSVAALAWLTVLLIHGAGASTWRERMFVAFLPLSMHATSITVGNGQLIIHVLPPLLTALIMAHGKPNDWQRSSVVAIFTLLALVKPTISVPFLWLVVFLPGTFKPILLVMAGYVGLSLFAASFQEGNLLSLISSWLTHGGMDPFIFDGGHSNLHSLLVSLGLHQWKLPASFLALVALGIWTYRYRGADLWLLLGVTGIVARLWSYHLTHDDLVIILSEVALYRTVRQRQFADLTGIVAAVLLTLSLLLMIPPPTRLFVFWPSLFRGGQMLVWVAVLIFLISQARRKQYSS
jgi:hypothetical protein